MKGNRQTRQTKTSNPRNFQQTPGTYPRPSTTCLWHMKEKSFHIGIFGHLRSVPGVCWNVLRSKKGVLQDFHISTQSPVKDPIEELTSVLFETWCFFGLVQRSCSWWFRNPACQLIWQIKKNISWKSNRPNNPWPVGLKWSMGGKDSLWPTTMGQIGRRLDFLGVSWICIKCLEQVPSMDG